MTETQEGEIVLSSNHAARQIADEFSHTSPDWDKFVAEFRVIQGKTRRYANVDDQLPGRLAELHLRTFLKSKNIKTSESLPSVISGEQYFLIRNIMGSFEAVEKGHPFKPLVEYDEICVIGGLPIVWEVKITDRTTGGGDKSQGINNMLRYERVVKLVNPLRDCLRTPNIGYFVVTSKNIHSISRENFISRGGVLVPFYTDTAGFKRDVEDVKKQYGL